MVLILDGNSEIGAHVWKDLDYLYTDVIGLDRGQSQIYFFCKTNYLFFYILAQHVPSYHLI